MSHAPSRARPAFTLVEMAVSLGVTSVLLLAMGSVMVLAARAVPEHNNRGSRALEAARALEMIADDLAYAEGIDLDPELKISVSDRGGDATPEVVTYFVNADQELVAEWRGSTLHDVPLIDGVAGADFKIDMDGAAVTAVTIELTLADMPAEPFLRRVSLVNRPEP